MKNYIFMVLFLLGGVSCSNAKTENTQVKNNNLVYKTIPTNWADAHPLGNGLLGAQVWQKGNMLRMSLDCANLWDLRPMKNVYTFTFKTVQEQVAKNDYGIIQKLGDDPYVSTTAPCKILGASLEFDISSFGEVEDYTLDLPEASCNIRWKNGMTLETFVHATKPVGWFKFSKVPENFVPSIDVPAYKGGESVIGRGAGSQQYANTLGYNEGKIQSKGNTIIYDQEGWGGFTYQVAVQWVRKNGGLEGVWSISTKFPAENILYKKDATVASQEVVQAIKEGFKKNRETHRSWWKDYWRKSLIRLPEDPEMEQFWYLEQFKFGSAARRGAPPMALKGVWGNDDGRLPKWKGDYHNDINTQYVYWTAYSGNRLEGEWSLIDWLWELRPNFREYTRKYFGVDGLNVPGVCTLDGKLMQGWIQYSNGLTVSAWFAHHFYLHWRYSMDREFLKTRAYPWFKEVITYLDNITVIDENGKRKLPLSSSPEYNDNSIRAWFKQTSNFDLANVRFVYSKGAELAGELGYRDEQQRWQQTEKEWTDFDLDEEGGLTIALGQRLNENHRHHSHLQAIFPFNIIDMSNGEKDQGVIKASLVRLEKFGPTVWPMQTAAYYARAWDGENTLKTLNKDFLNKKVYYKDDGNLRLKVQKYGHYYPIVIQEMLLQSHSGYINIFPAVPEKWENCSFENLRAEGAFLVSAARKDGKTASVKIFSEKGGVLRVKNPFGPSCHNKKAKENADNSIWEFECKPNEIIDFK